MKRNKWLQKLLAAGLAVAVAAASLTGPGSLTHPAEVLAEEQGDEDVSRYTEIRVTASDLTYDGTEKKPTAITISVPQASATTGGGITITSGSSIGVQAGSPISVLDAAQTGNWTVTYNDQETAPKNAGTVTVKVVPKADKGAEGTLTATYTIEKASLTTADDVKKFFTVSEIKESYPAGTEISVTATPQASIDGYETAVIKYKKGADGALTETAPTEAGSYTVYFTLEAGTNFNAANVEVGAFTITAADTPAAKPAAPTITPAAQTFTDSLTVTITASEADTGAKIYYTTDGSAPTKESTEYAAAFTINATTTVKAIAVKDDQVSDAASVTYTKSSGTGGSTGGSTGGTTGGTTAGTGGTTGTTTETKPDGTKVETTTETKPDGTTTTTVKEKETNAAGKEVAVETTVVKDASGKVTAETTTSVIAEAEKGTSATVTVVKDSTGAQTAAAEVTKTGTTNLTGSVKGSISAAVVSQVVAAAGTSDVTITQTVTDAAGDTKFTVAVNAKDLVSGETLKIMKLDPKTGEYVLCNKKDYDVNGAGGVNLTLKTEGDFILLNEADAKAASDEILGTVKVKKSSATVKKGKSTSVAMSSKFNKKNVSKITYTVTDKSVATVDKNGKVKAKKAGTVTVKAKVTLKNGKTKTVKMTIKVK